MSSRNFIKSALEFDPVAEAEKMLDTGNSLGKVLALTADRRAMVNRLMKDSGDVCSDTTYEEYCQIVADYGFTQIYEECFPGNYREETLRMFWHTQGFLLLLESFSWGHQETARVNGAKIYYNFQVETAQIKDFWRNVSSGSFVRHVDSGDSTNVWAGDHDVRQGLKYTIQGLLEHGTPLAVWEKAPSMWLLNHKEAAAVDFKDSQHSNHLDNLMMAKIDQFPANIGDMIKAAILRK